MIRWSTLLGQNKAMCISLTWQYRITTGFFVENTIVLAEGEMLLDGIFQVCVGNIWPCKCWTNNAYDRIHELCFLSWALQKLPIFASVNGLQVKTCGFPPLEDREKSLAMLAGVDFFGGGSLEKEEIVSFEKSLLTVTSEILLQFRK